ncbi:MAG: insulinase family protein, partial [Rhodothermia bacterium]|nr:insulinase family protein [Rhodothermia bacterium]
MAEPTPATTVQAVGLVSDSDEPLPLDDKVRVGKLDNGLTYYVRKNTKPADRAELRLVVDVGSVLEADDQRGLAHFAEHMAFNGTERFEKQELVDYLELTGSRFGADVNAYTSFDETVYMLKVRTDSTELLDTGIEILREWASRISFDPDEIDKERGVVIEEWRLGRGAQMRIANEQLPVLLRGSRYADRLPIGTKDVLETFEHPTLTSFYEDWYRPDLMAVMAIGDFDADRIEDMIQELFSDLESPPDPRLREEFSVPGNEEPLVALATDPEATFGSVSLIFKIPEQDINSLEGYRKSMVESLYHAMLNSRLQELTQDADPPFAFAGSGRGSFARNPDFYSLGAIVQEGQMVRALEVLLAEAERVRRFGFTATELERAKSDLLRSMERAFNERDKTESARYAGEYVRHFLVDEPSPGIEFEYEMTREVLPGIGIDEINDLAESFVTKSNRVVLADGPEKEGLTYPTKDELLAVFDQVEARSIAPYEDRVRDEPLLGTIPTPGAITSEETYPDVGVTRLKLSNGAQVILKPTDFKNDEVLIRGYSPGGHSLLEDADYFSAARADTIVARMGLGEFDSIELGKALTGKIARASAFIGELSEGITAS